MLYYKYLEYTESFSEDLYNRIIKLLINYNWKSFYVNTTNISYDAFKSCGALVIINSFSHTWLLLNKLKIGVGYSKISVGELLVELESNQKSSLDRLLILKKEAVKRGFVEGAKFIDLSKNCKFTVKKESFDTFGNDDQLYVSIVPRSDYANKSARIYYKGKWAEILETNENLINKARSLYKIGDVVDQKLAYNGSGNIVTISSDKIDVTQEGERINISVGGIGVYNSLHKIWAPVVKTNSIVSVSKCKYVLPINVEESSIEIVKGVKPNCHIKI